MSRRLRKLIGTAVFVVSTTIYFLFAITVAIARLPGTPMAVQLLFYFVTTLIWLVPAAMLVRWMQRPSLERTA